MIRIDQPRTRRVLAAVGALAALSAGLAPAADARPRGSEPSSAKVVFTDSFGSSSSSGASASSAHHNHPNPAFAGYLTTRTGRAAVQARFAVPKLTCTGRERAISPGVFLLSGPLDHEYFNAANIILGCFKGHRVAEETLVINNIEKDVVKPLHTGDVIVARVSDRPGGSMTVLVKDLTPGHRFFVILNGRGVGAQSELVGDWASADNSTGAAVAPPFVAPTTFMSSRVDGRPLGSLKPTGYDMSSSAGKVEITAGPLSGSLRDTFTCTRGRH